MSETSLLLKPRKSCVNYHAKDTLDMPSHIVIWQIMRLSLNYLCVIISLGITVVRLAIILCKDETLKNKKNKSSTPVLAPVD